MTDHVTPTDDRLTFTATRGAEDESPVVMLNLNRYRDRAAYPPDTPDSDVSGREAYLRYGVVAYAAIQSVEISRCAVSRSSCPSQTMSCKRSSSASFTRAFQPFAA